MEDITKEEACGFLDAVQDPIAEKVVERINDFALRRDVSVLPAVALLIGSEVAVDMIKLIVARDPDVLSDGLTWDDLALNPENAANAIMSAAAATFTKLVEHVTDRETRA